MITKQNENGTELTAVTRELILSNIDELKEKLSVLQRRIDIAQKSINDDEFIQIREIEGDIMRGNIERLTNILIENKFEFHY